MSEGFNVGWAALFFNVKCLEAIYSLIYYNLLLNRGNETDKV